MPLKTTTSDTPPAVKTTTMDTPLGLIRLYAEAGSMVGIDFPGHDSGWPQGAAADAADPALAAAVRQLREYFAGGRTRFDLPLRPAGTPFQQAVWDALGAIPFGATCSYGEIAAAVQRPRASRAVGAANGRNTLPIVIPCHRVIGSNGSLTGYGDGMAIKRWLLDHEAACRFPKLELSGARASQT